MSTAVAVVLAVLLIANLSAYVVNARLLADFRDIEARARESLVRADQAFADSMRLNERAIQRNTETMALLGVTSKTPETFT